jgi:hypothetical protein
MRLITFILSAGMALTCVPACASAQSNTVTQTSVHHHHHHPLHRCPKYEGYPDCGHDGVARSIAPAPSQHVAYGGLWRPSRAARLPRQVASR